MPAVINNVSSCENCTGSFTQPPAQLMLGPISTATAPHTGHAGLNCSYKRLTGENLVQRKLVFLPVRLGFSGVDDPVLASMEWFYSMLLQGRKPVHNDVSASPRWQPACPVLSSFLFFDIPIFLWRVEGHNMLWPIFCWSERVLKSKLQQVYSAQHVHPADARESPEGTQLWVRVRGEAAK